MSPINIYRGEQMSTRKSLLGAVAGLVVVLSLTVAACTSSTTPATTTVTTTATATTTTTITATATTTITATPTNTATATAPVTPGGPGGGAVINSDSVITAKIQAVRNQPTGFPWEVDVLIENSVDVGSLPNPTKDSVGKVITVKTDEDMTPYKVGDVINAKVKYVGDVPKPGITLYMYNIAHQIGP
jgi:hypothetical protein